MKRSESIKELATALAKAQGDIKEASKDSTNPHFKSNYADLASVWEVCRGPLSKNGLSIIQSPSTKEDGSIILTTILLHASGEYYEEELQLFPRDKTPQSMGSAITYGRRYALMAIVGVAPGGDEKDDDGNAASLPDSKEMKSDRPPLSLDQKEKMKVTQKQIQRLFAIGSKAIERKQWTKEGIDAYIHQGVGITHMNEMNMRQYDEICDSIEHKSQEQVREEFKQRMANKLPSEGSYDPNFADREPGEEG